MGFSFFNRENRVNATVQGLNVAVGLYAVIDYLANPEANTAMYCASLALNLATGFSLRQAYGASQMGTVLTNVAYSGVVFSQTLSACNEMSTATLLMEGAAMTANIATLIYNAGKHHKQRSEAQWIQTEATEPVATPTPQ